MISAILKQGLTMVAYAASAKFTGEAAKWGSSAFRTGARRAIRYAENRGLVDKTVASKIARYTQDNQWSGPQSLPARMGAAANRFAKSRLTKSQYQGYRRVKRALKDEALFMPANYVMYRLEKSAATTPEEKEMTKSFTKYYVGMPMAVSIGFGSLMQPGNKMVQRGTAALLKKFSPERQQKMLGRGMRVFQSAIEVGNQVGNYLAAAANTRARLTEGKGVLSLLGKYQPAEIMAKVPRLYREELIKAKQPMKSSLDVLIEQTKAFRAKMNERLTEELKGIPGMEAQYKFERDFTQTINKTEQEIFESYNASIKRQTGTMKFVNAQLGLMRNRNQNTRQFMQNVTKTKRMLSNEDFSWIGKEGFPKTMAAYEGPGFFSVGDKRLDLGRLSVSFLRDSLIGATESGLPNFALRLFGVREILDYKKSSNALGLAFTPTSRGSIFMPKPAYDASFADDTRQAAVNVYKQMLGPGASDSAAENLLNSRRPLFNQRLGGDKGKELADAAAITMGAFGELPLHGGERGDWLVHLPGGSMKLMTQGGGQGSSHDLMSFNLGSTSTGSALKFLKFTKDTNSIPTKLMRNWLGRYEGEITPGVGFTAGPTPSGRIIETGETVGFFSWMKRKLELGYSQETSIFSKIGSIFKKHTDPRYPTTLFSDEHLKSGKFINDIIDNDVKFGKTGRSIVDLLDVLRNGSREATDEFYIRTLNRARTTKELKNSMVRAYDGLDSNYQNAGSFMLTPDMSIEQARNLSKDLQEVLRTIPRGTGILRQDADDLRRMVEVLHTGDTSTVLEQLATKKSGRKVFVKGRTEELSLMDAYNSDVLRILTGYNESAARSINPGENLFGTQATVNNVLAGMREFAIGEKEISAFLAGSHMSKLHHQVALTYSSVQEHMPDVALNGTKEKLKSIIGSMTKSVEYDNILLYYNKKFKYAPFTPWDFDQRLKLDQPASTEYFAIPKGMHGEGLGRRVVDLPGGARASIGHGMIDTAGVMTMTLFHAFNRAASEFLGIGFDETRTTTPGQYFSKMAFKRVIPGIAAYMGYSVADRMADRYLDGTPLGEGLTVFGANVLAGARVAAQGIMDVTHLSDASRYLEDLMPGIITSPGSGAIRGFGPVALGMWLGSKRGGPRGSLMGGIVGSALGGLLGGGPLGVFGMWDISKYRGEVIEELTGEKEVAVKKGRWWELSSSPFEGTKVSYFRPHIYAMTRSKYKETPGLKDSIFTDLVGTIAPDIYAVKNYYSRPYPVTAGLFSNIPVFSSMLHMMPGSSLLTGAGIDLHPGEYSPGAMLSQASDSGLSTAQIARQYNEQYGAFSSTNGSAGGFPAQEGYENPLAMSPRPMDRSSAEWAIGESLANVKDIVGLRGFLMGSMFSEMTGRTDLFDYAPELASPVDITGIKREYWDLELGGLLGVSEVIRRYIPHRRNQIQVLNPLRNTMPTWLPGRDHYIDFQRGDPYTAVPMGEARLPGPGYETLHDIDLTFPIEASILGMEEESQKAWYVGKPSFMAYYNKMHDAIDPVREEILSSARAYGDVLKKATSVYNPTYDTYATADSMIRSATGEKMAIKVVPKGFAGESTINAFLVMADVNQGLLVEVDPEKGGATERLVTKDVERFKRELSRARKSSWAAYTQIADMDKKGDAMNLANAYSWADRHKILADVAPYSKEFREVSAIVQQQMMAGRLKPTQVGEYYQTMDQVDQKMKTMPTQEYRFSTIGKSLTPYGQAKDEFYSQEYSYLERQVGSMWERFSHLRSPIHSKMLHYADPLEEYERTAIYGKRIKMWERPIEDFAKSYYYSMVAEEDPVQSVLSWGTGGLLMGGTPLGAAMSVAGLASSLVNKISGNVFVPERVTERREIVEQMDAVKYAKYKKLYMETGDRSWLMKAGRTITGSTVQGNVLSPKSAGSYYGDPENDFVEDIINNVTTANIHRVRELLPSPAVATMYNQIGNPDLAKGLMRGSVRDEFSRREIPGFESSIYSENVPIESPAIKTFQMEGLDAHDAGMGWYDQMATLARSERAGLYNGGDTLYPTRFGSRVGSGEFAELTNQKNEVRKALSKLGSNVIIVDDGLDYVTIEVVVGP